MNGTWPCHTLHLALTHMSVLSLTKVSPFEFAHGIPARIPLTFGQPSAQAPPGEVLDMGAAAISNRIKMRHWAAADHMTEAQARLGHLLAKRSRPATLNVRDLVWLDSRHTTNEMTFHSNLPPGGLDYSQFFKLRVPRLHWIYHLCLARHIVRSTFSRLKIFESRDRNLGPANVYPQPLWGHDVVPHYEINRICNARCHKGVDELWVEWQGYDQSQNGWVAQSSLLQDVPHLVHAFEANPSVFKPRKSAPKRASTAVRDSVLPPPPPALPVAPRHPRQVRSAVVFGNPMV